MADNFFGGTDTGRVRENNEDAFIAEKLPGGWLVACVIDGVGGYEGGEVAAAIARTTILSRLKQPFSDAVAALHEAVITANESIYKEKQAGGNSQMACVLTVALVDIEANQFYYAHVGDTRMYLLRDGSLVKVTKDQSFVGFLEDSGRLSEKQAMAHPKRNEINNALGFDVQVVNDPDYIETGTSPFLPGDMLLLCSDGLTDMVNAAGITAILVAKTSLAQKTQQLIEAANVAGGKDNITAVLVTNNKKPGKQTALKPATTQLKKEDGVGIDEPPPLTPEGVTAMVVQKRQRGYAVFSLAFLCLLLAGGCYWLWAKNNDLIRQQAVIPIPRNDGEKKAADSLATADKMIELTAAKFGSAVTLTDTIFIRQDSLHINGAGMVLQSDSTYKGPAFFVTANCKYLLLENMGFKNFPTAVIMQGRGLQLKNVVFQNSAAPVQQQYLLPLNDSLTGRLSDSFFIKKDSLPK